MIHSTRIKAIDNSPIKDGADDKRTIPPGLFKPHTTTLISGKTGSGKSTALIRMLKAYCDAGRRCVSEIDSDFPDGELRCQIQDAAAHRRA